jgi:DNA-binding beta-propeller fold protein YncE
VAAVVALTLCSGCERQSQGTESSARIIGTCGVGPGQFGEPRAIAASPDGKLFVIDKTGRVQRFSASGQFEHSWQMPDSVPDQGQPSGLCVDHAGRVFVADTHQSRVVVFDRGGVELFRFGERGMGPGQFMLPTDVAVDSRGFIYVAEYGGNDRISKFDPERNYLFSFGGPASGTGMLQRPSGLAVNADDNLWVADAGNHRVCCFSPDGELLKSVGRLGGAAGELRYPRDLLILSDGNLVVVDSGNDRLAWFDLEGECLACWGHAGRRAGEFNMPLNTAATDGHLFVADSKNHRVVVSAYRSSELPQSGVVASSAGTAHSIGD